MKKVTFLLIFLLTGIMSFSQHKDYTEIRFKSKLRSYTKVKPKTAIHGITRELFVELVDHLTMDAYDSIEKESLSNKLWLAVSNPEKFDFVYKDYSLSTIKNWGVKIKFEDPNFEPNPYLARWTVTGDEFIYFQWAITQILTHEKLMVYSEKAKVAQKAIYELKLVEGIKFYQAKPDEFSYDYLHRNNQLLRNKGLVFLIYNHHYDYFVCELASQDRVIELMGKLKWEFIAP